MKIKQVGSAIAVTTFIAPAYINSIAPQVNNYSNIEFNSKTTLYNEVDFSQLKINNFVESVTDQKLSLTINTYADDLEYTYVSIMSNSLSIDDLFNIEESLNDEALSKGFKYIFTVGD